MKRYTYRALLYLLNTLVYLKRFVFWFGSIIASVFLFISKGFRNTIGFRLYKLKFQIQKHTSRIHLPWNGRLIEFIGKRSVLQGIIFIIIFTILIPQTNLYSQDITKVPGRDTLLYKIVGPGDQDFSIEEIKVDYSAIVQKETNTWDQGSIQAQPGGALPTQIQPQQNITSIAAGGTALTKPNIISGATLPTTDGSTNRNETIFYTVQSGDTIGQIAEKHQVDLATILWSNGLTTRSYIRPGDKLKILPVSGLVHKVKRGDTLSKLARTYDAEVDKIIEFNKLKKDGSDIAIGEELIIPGGIKPRPIARYTPPPVERKYTQLSNIAAPPPSIATPAGSGYLWPASCKTITQYYHWRHTAIDIGCRMATPIYASRAGKVIISQCGWNGGYGCYTKIDHGGGVQTLYAHNSRLLVSVGDQVAQGQTIALMGNTGNVRGITGIHLHFEVRVNGRQLNPLSYVK